MNFPSVWRKYKLTIYEHVKGHISVPVYKANGDYAGYTEEIDFTEDDIIKDSCSITERACDDGTFSLGGVRPAELSINLRLEGETINAYNLYGAKVTLYSCYVQNPVESDWVFRGLFWVTSVSRKNTVYTLRASDALVWLDSGSFIASDGKTETKNQKTPMEAKLAGHHKTIGGCFDTILEAINEELTKAGIENITMYELPEISSPSGIFMNNAPKYPTSIDYVGDAIRLYGILDKDDGYFSTHTNAEYVKYLAELMGGFCMVRPCNPSNPAQNGLQVMIVPFGYCNGATGFGEITVNYDEISSDSCDIAGYKMSFQNFYMKTWDETGWSNYYAPSQYGANTTIDLSGNTFLDGRHHGMYRYDERENTNFCNDPNCNTFEVINTLAGYLRSLVIRPFSLKCHKAFGDWEQYPKLGMKIHIKDADDTEKESILTKVVWNFRGGWEFGCAGSDERVLSQGAKQSLARHAKNDAKTYASVLASRVNDIAKKAQDTADDAKEIADDAKLNVDKRFEDVQNLENTKVSIDDYNNDIAAIWNAINSI
jgi:hypothetical protein